MTRDPFEPMRSATQIVLTLLTMLILLSVVTTVLGSGAFMGIGSSSICVEARSGVVPVPQRDASVVSNTVEGVTSSAQTVSLCDSTPTALQRVLYAFTGLSGPVVLIGALLLCMRVFRVVRREGTFGDRVPGMMSTVGVFVVVGALAGTLLESVARFWLTNTMVSALPGLSWLGDWDVPFLALFVGVIMVSFARIMRVSTAMREELDGTV